MLRGWTECTVSRRAQPGNQNSFRVFKHGISHKELVTQRLEELRSPGGDGKVTRNPLLVLGWGENSVVSGGGARVTWKKLEPQRRYNPLP